MTNLSGADGGALASDAVPAVPKAPTPNLAVAVPGPVPGISLADAGAAHAALCAAAERLSARLQTELRPALSESQSSAGALHKRRAALCQELDVLGARAAAAAEGVNSITKQQLSE